METVFDQLIDKIATYLELKHLYHLLLVNKRYNNILISERFWRHKIKRDHHLTVKHNNQTWIDRYKLASSMGQILIKDLCNSSPVHFDIGVELNIENFSGVRLLPYKAIIAILIRPCIYYIDDNYNLYMVGEPCYAGRIYKVPELLDINVTKLTGGPHDFFYIKDGDIYDHTLNGKRQITDRHDIIDFSFCYPFISYITDRHELYQIEHDENIDQWIPTNQEQKDIIKVLQYGDALLFVNKHGQLKTDNISLNRKISNYPSLNDIVDIYGQCLFVTNNDKLISINMGKSVDEYYFKYESFDIKYVTDASVWDYSSDKAVRTKNGEIYISTYNDEIVKLNIKAKNICYSPENIILII